MESYKKYFDAAEEQFNKLPVEERLDVYKNWREAPAYFHFIMAADHLLISDEQALQIALDINPVFSTFMIGKGPFRNNTNIDAVECRHILMCAFLEMGFGKDWGNVVELGGGYGNFLRLINGWVTYDSWTIVDLPHILGLQKYVLGEQGIVGITFSQEIPPNPDLVIASHSLSEFDKDTFDNYLEAMLGAKFVMYVTHKATPSPELVDYKLTRLLEEFEAVTHLDYEGNECRMILFKRRIQP